MVNRPASVGAVIILLCVAAVAMLGGAVGSLVLFARPGAVQELFGQPVSDWYWLLAALLAATLAGVLLLLARAVASADPGAGVAVSVICMFSVGFSLLAITNPLGWLLLAVGLLTLVLNQTGAAQRWYHPGTTGKATGDQAQT